MAITVVVVIQLPSLVWLFVTPRTAAHQASLSLIISQSLPKFMSIESMMPSNHLILCHPLILLPSSFPNIRVFFKWVSSSYQVAKVLEKTLMLGKTESRRRGWQKMRWLDSITDSMDMNLGKLWEMREGQGGMVCCSCKELDTTWWLNDKHTHPHTKWTRSAV